MERQIREKDESRHQIAQELQHTSTRLQELEEERQQLQQERDLIARQQVALKENAGSVELSMYCPNSWLFIVLALRQKHREWVIKLLKVRGQSFLVFFFVFAFVYYCSMFRLFVEGKCGIRIYSDIFSMRELLPKCSFKNGSSWIATLSLLLIKHSLQFPIT